MMADVRIDLIGKSARLGSNQLQGELAHHIAKYHYENQKSPSHVLHQDELELSTNWLGR